VDFRYRCRQLHFRAARYDASQIDRQIKTRPTIERKPLEARTRAFQSTIIFNRTILLKRNTFRTYKSRCIINERVCVAVATRMAVKLRSNWRERAVHDNAFEPERKETKH